MFFDDLTIAYLFGYSKQHSNMSEKVIDHDLIKLTDFYCTTWKLRANSSKPQADKNSFTYFLNFKNLYLCLYKNCIMCRPEFTNLRPENELNYELIFKDI